MSNVSAGLPRTAFEINQLPWIETRLGTGSRLDGKASRLRSQTLSHMGQSLVVDGSSRFAVERQVGWPVEGPKVTSLPRRSTIENRIAGCDFHEFG
jgi:hypothetical protein